MKQPPTFKQVSRIVFLLSKLQTKIKTLPDGYKSVGQREAAKVLCDNTQIVLQMHRRSGKSFIVAVIAAIYILHGGTVILGAPTLGQSSRIIYTMITEIMDILCSILGGIRRLSDNRTYNIWSNGGCLMAMTANLSSKQQEGFGGALLLLDEGHSLDPAILPVMAPSIDDAMETGIGKIVILGVGGLPSTLIETMKDRKGWVSYMYRASDETQESKQAIFQTARDTHPHIHYIQHYECEQVSAGSRKCFPVMHGRIDTTRMEKLGIKRLLYFGIDVGKVDETVVCVKEQYGEIFNIIDHFAISGPDHVPIVAAVYRFIDQYVWLPERIVVEHNNAGTYFQDTLRTNHDMDSRAVVTYEGFSDANWHSSHVAMREGKLGVPDLEMYKRLDNMSYSIKQNGHYNFAHCDYYSAFTMAWSCNI